MYMEKQGSDKKQLWIILVIIFIGFLGVSMPYLIFPALFLNPAYSVSLGDWSSSNHAILLGITLASYPLGQFIGSPILGALSDHYGRRRLLSGSLLCAALCNLCTGLALEWGQLVLVIASRFVAGLMEGNIAIARAMAADLKSISKHTTFGKINAVISIAFLFGPLFGGLLVDNTLFPSVTNSTPFYLISFLFVFLSVSSAMMLRADHSVFETSFEIEIKKIWQHFNLIKKMSILFKNRQARFLIIASTFFSVAMDIFFEFGPVHLTAMWLLGPFQLVIYNSILCVGIALGSSGIVSFIATRYSSRFGIIVSMGMLAIVLLAIALVGVPLYMMILFGLSGLCIGLGSTLITVNISDSVSDAIQGAVMGVQLSLRVLGDAVICLLGGVLLLFSSDLILIIAAAVLAITVVYYVVESRGVRGQT